MFRSLLPLTLLFTLACTTKATTTDDTDTTTDDSSAPADDTSDPADDSGTGDSQDSAPEDTGSEGATLYADNCARCHGDEAQGGSGPGLERELGHSDEDIVSVILNGKRDMPAIDVTEEEAYAIVAWLRELFAR